MRCDLHMHSRCSDGTLEVESLVDTLHAAGVSVFSLTDHDTLAGLARAEQAAQRHGMRAIPGVEISTRLGSVQGSQVGSHADSRASTSGSRASTQIELHILGYGFDVHDAELNRALSGQRAARESRIPRIVDKLVELGLEISVDDVYREAGEAAPGRPHVARALVRRGHVRDTDEAFRRYLGDAGPAQIQKDVPEPAAAIAWIHAAGGKAVWAHPLARPIQRPGGFELLLRELRAQGLDGVEEIHPGHDPSARRRIRKLARELGLALTGGSDFHGEASPGVSVGVGRGHDDIPLSVVDALFA
jgi:predicted metal-dependent phosphoesterase TrpH